MDNAPKPEFEEKIGEQNEMSGEMGNKREKNSKNLTLCLAISYRKPY